MANREELAIIRGARSGDAACQLQLGRLYLAGGASLPCSLPTALHWLARAAAAGQDEAWRLIGRHIPWQLACHARPALLDWYARASAAGIVPAAVTLGQLLLQDPPITNATLRRQARQALEAAVQAGAVEARALLARLRPAEAVLPATPAAGTAPGHPIRFPHLDRLWHDGAGAGFLVQALPVARSIAAAAPSDAAAWQGGTAEASLLARCADALADAGSSEVQRLRELAAAGGDRDAQLVLGLQLARMDVTGERLPHPAGQANFKRAIRWLTQAGEQGAAPAWFALSRIYMRPECSQRSAGAAQTCIERAAELGHRAAQLECGMHAWRLRRGGEENDVKAAYWLQKAAAQGCVQAGAALQRIAPPPEGPGWAAPLLPLLTRELASSQPLLAARIELAGLFHLSRAEALLLDVAAADHGHCLVIDIRASHGRSRRRLVPVDSARQRQALDRIVRVFDTVDCSLAGPEGNYRQRLYRFKTWLLAAGGSGALLAA